MDERHVGTRNRTMLHNAPPDRTSPARRLRLRTRGLAVGLAALLAAPFVGAASSGATTDCEPLPQTAPGVTVSTIPDPFTSAECDTVRSLDPDPGGAVPRSVSVVDGVYVEGVSGTAQVRFPLVATGLAGETITVGYTLADGAIAAGTAVADVPAATAGDDYTDPGPGAQTTVTVGDPNAAITVPVTAPDDNEPLEAFHLTITPPAGVTAPHDTANALIGHAPNPTGALTPAVAVTATAVPAVEGTDNHITVTLQAHALDPDTEGFSIELSVATDDTDTLTTATPASDYTATTDTVTLTDTATSDTVQIPITDDTTHEHTETIALDVTVTSGTATLTHQPVAAIVDNDTPEVETEIVAVAVLDGTVTNDADGDAVIRFPVVASSPTPGPVELGVTVVDGVEPTGTSLDTLVTPTGSDDYVAPAGPVQVDLSAGQAFLDIEIAAPDSADAIVEALHVTVTPTSADADVVAARPTANGFLTAVPTPAVDPVVAVAPTAGAEATGSMTFRVVAAGVTEPLVFDVGVTYDSTDADDLGAYTETLTVGADGTYEIDVELVDDGDFEQVEGFSISLTGAATLNPASQTTALGVITDPEDAPSIVPAVDPVLIVGDAIGIENSNGATDLMFPVVVTPVPQGEAITAAYATGAAGDTAHPGTHYEPRSGERVFTPDVPLHLVPIPTVDNGSAEAPPGVTRFTVSVDAPEGVAAVRASGTGTIVDDDAVPDEGAPDPQSPLPILSVTGPGAAVEGDAGTTQARFGISLSAPAIGPVEITYSTVDGSATAGGDYVAQIDQTLTIDAGASQAHVDVTINGDGVYEGDEDFSLVVTKATGTVLDRERATATIGEDDQPSLSLADVNVKEGGEAAFHLELSEAVPLPVSLDVRTAPGSAVSGSDYLPAPRTTVVFDGSTVQTVTVATVDDALDEHDETFALLFDNADGILLGDGKATATILDGDPLPVLEVRDAAAEEGDSSTTSVIFRIDLSAPSGREVRGRARTVDGTATAGADFEPVDSAFSIPPGTTSADVVVEVVGDADAEPDEAFAVVVEGVQHATVADGVARGTIRSDDGDAMGAGDRVVAPRGATTPSGKGYVIVRSDGSIQGFGDAEHLTGASAASTPAGAEIVAIALTPTADGYWLLDEHGGVHTSGDAAFHGSLPARRVAGSALGHARAMDIAATASGRGYYVLDAAGGVHTFGDARFFGSIPGRRAAGHTIGRAAATSIALAPNGRGYWVLDEAGGVHTFGQARYLGSIPALRIAGREIGRARATAIETTPTGRGYWVFDTAGGVFTFGNAVFAGSLPGLER